MESNSRPKSRSHNNVWPPYERCNLSFGCCKRVHRRVEKVTTVTVVATGEINISYVTIPSQINFRDHGIGPEASLYRVHSLHCRDLDRMHDAEPAVG